MVLSSVFHMLFCSRAFPLLVPIYSVHPRAAAGSTYRTIVSAAAGTRTLNDLIVCGLRISVLLSSSADAGSRNSPRTW